jgi:predicted enzyme related to lactoylglutathione lyase
VAKNERDNQQANETSVDARLTRHGGLSYLEIPTVDPRKSADFFESVLGWNIRQRDTSSPRFEDATGHLIGRWVTGCAVSREPGLMPYFYVDCINESVARVAPQGGEVLKGPYPEGNLRVATVRDPAGNVIGLWQESPR